MNASHRAMLRSTGTLIGRILLASLFLYSAVGILLNGVGNTVGYYETMSVPVAGMVVWLILAVKFLGGAALVLGYRTEMAAAALLLFTVATIFIAHADVNDINLWKNLSIIGGLLYVMAYGPGDGWSIANKTDNQTVSTGNMAI